jgi:hypothetical protein
MHHERHDGGILVTTDPARLDLDAIHDFLAGSSYWATGIPREVMERSIRHSICFGAFDGGRQVGFARVISDRATFAYVCDVFVLAGRRGRGVGPASRVTPSYRTCASGPCSRGTPTGSTASTASATRATRTGSWSGAPSAPMP